MTSLEINRPRASRDAAIALAAILAGGTGIGLLSTTREVSAQNSTSTPASTDVITGQVTPAPKEVLLKNPITENCVLVIFPNATLAPDIQPAVQPTPVLVAQAIEDGQATEQPVTTAGPTQEPEQIALVEGSPLPEGEQPDFSTWLPCEDGEEPTATMTAKPTQKASQDPNPTLSPAEIEKLVQQYSLEEFLKKKDPPLKAPGYNRIINRSLKVMSEFMQTHGEPVYTLEYLTQEEKDFLTMIQRGWSMDWAGFRIANAVNINIRNAKTAASEGNVVAAEAFTNVAEARVRLGKTMINFEDSPEALDKEIVRIAKSGIWDN